MISVVRESSKHKDFQQLVRLLDAHLNAQYGTLQAAYDQYNATDSIETVVLAYVDQQPVGCGGLRSCNRETGEIKRMYVKPTYRNRGIAGHILQELERRAVELGSVRTILETGKRQVEAIGFYRKHGYRQIDNYGQYAGNPNSLCFEKTLQEPVSVDPNLMFRGGL